MNLNQKLKFICALFIAISIYMLPVPAGLSLHAWHLFAIFLGTILLVVLGAFPMGAASLMGLTAALLTKTLSFEQAFKGYTSPITWLILSAFFISFGFVHTGLGHRIALYFISFLGKNPLGLAYGISLAELTLAPGTPSSTARSGGIIFPIVDSINKSFDSYPNKPSRNKIGKYLILCLFNSTVISSAMFLTAMAANPFTAQLANMVGANITWGNWALYALAPGLASLFMGPLFLVKIFGPELQETNNAKEKAQQELRKLGPLKHKESLMALVFFLLVLFWVLGPVIHINAATSALLGLSLLLILGICTWGQLLKLSGAFETFIWFGALLALAEGLSSTGFTDWFAQQVVSSLSGLSPILAIILLFLIYFYAHYFFASCTAHVGALYLPFVKSCVVLGAPILLTAYLFAFASALFGTLTHYGIGPAPILFGSGYVNLGEWWRAGFLLSILNLIIWATVGSAWWWLLGII